MSHEVDESVESILQPITLRRFDGRGLIRALLWGAAAAAAVAIMVGAAMSDTGSRRLKEAMIAVMEPAKATPSAPAVTPQELARVESETRQLVKAVHDLTADRDDLKARLASIEQNLSDVTGAIKRQAAAHEPPPPAPAVAAPVAAAPVQQPDRTAAAAPQAATADDPVPLPPTRVASAAPVMHEPAPVAAARQIGIDIGGAPSLEELHSRWSAIKANVGPDVVGLRPSYTVRRRPNGVADYRLVLAPFSNTTDALRTCARLNASKVFCRAGYFNGAQLVE